MEMDHFMKNESELEQQTMAALWLDVPIFTKKTVKCHVGEGPVDIFLQLP